ncbi:MAG: DUF4124 domain-containing protein [Betaproteobacteria bacterium]
MKSPIQLFIAIAILLATATVAAQVYKWVDKDGKVQYTDTPPPPGATKTEAKKVETGNAAASTAPAPAQGLDDRAKAYDKRRTDAAESAKKAEEVRKKDETASENCKLAQSALRDLESGRPIRRTNDKGEIAIMSDEEREAEIVKVRATAAASCKA